MILTRIRYNSVPHRVITTVGSLGVIAAAVNGFIFRVNNTLGGFNNRASGETGSGFIESS